MEPGSWRSKLSLVGLILAWAVVVYMLILLFHGESGFRETERISRQIEELKERNRELEVENEKLMNEIEYRRSEVYLEELARLELRKINEGEKALIWPTPTWTPEK